MTMSEPIAEMLTRIQNGQQAAKAWVAMPHSKLRAAVADVLKEEGHIRDFATTGVDGNATLTVMLDCAGRPSFATQRNSDQWS